MKLQQVLLSAYSALLQLYPSSFKKRFAAEMLEVAQAAEPTDWLFFLCDTTASVLQSWLEVATTGATAPAEPDGYLALGDSRLTAARLAQVFVLSVVILLAACYISRLPFWQLPADEDCRAISTQKAQR